MLLLAIIAIGAVSASDENITSDELAANEEMDVESSIDQIELDDSAGGVVESSGNEEILSNDSGTFSELSELISTNPDNQTLELKKDYMNGGETPSGGIRISKSITIDGKGHVLDANGNSKMFLVLSDVNLILKNITFKNAHDDMGGAIYSVDGCDIVDCTFINCSATEGGAVYNGRMYGCKFINCSAVEGGAIYSGSGYDCTFINCSAAKGGAIYFYGIFGIYNSCFENCHANDTAGAIYDVVGANEINNCTFTDCTAAEYAGAVYNGQAINSTFVNCTSGNGYAVKECSLFNCTFIDCTAGYTTALEVRLTKDDIAVNENTTINFVTVRQDDDSILNVIDGTVTVDVDGTVYTTDIVGGYGSYTLSNLSPGEHSVNVTFIGNGVYLPVSSIVTVNVLNSTDIIITVVGDKPITSNVPIRILLDEQINTVVSVYDGDGYYLAGVTITQGKGEYNLSGLEYGLNEITVKFSGNGYFSKASNSTSIMVYDDPMLDVWSIPKTMNALNDLSFSLSTAVESYSYDNCIKINLTCGNRTFEKRFSYWRDENIFEDVTFEKLAAGEYTLTVSYDGYGRYGPSKLTKTVSVIAIDPNIQVRIPDNNYEGSNATVTVSISNKFDGNVKCLFDNEEYKLNFTNGWAVLNLVNLKNGNHTIQVMAFGSENFKEQNVTSSFLVFKDSNLEITTENVIYGETSHLNITINEDVSGDLRLYVDGNEYPSPLAPGKTSIPLSDLSKGKHNIRVEFGGDDVYGPSTKYAAIMVTSDPKTASLSELIGELESGDVIVLQKDYAVNSTIIINNAITIDGNGHTLDAGGSCSIFTANADNVYLKNIVFKNTFDSGDGGAVYSSFKDVYITNCTFIKCFSGSSGGAIYGNYGKIDDCRFVECSANYGGAVYLSSGTSKYGAIHNSKFIDCSATTSGGAIYGRCDVNDCYILNCSAKYGGGIYSSWDMVNVTIENCSATTRGGAVDWHYLSYNGAMHNSTLINCNAPKGSFIYAGGDEMVHYACYNTRFENVASESNMIKAEKNLPVLTDCSIVLSPNLKVGISNIDETSAVVSISVLQTAKGTVVLSLNGKSQTVELVDGKNNVSLSDLKVGDLITVKFIAQDGFSNMTRTVVFTVPEDNGTEGENTTPVEYPVVVTASDLSMMYSSSSAFKVTVYGTDGNPASGTSVVIKVAGKQVATVKTDSNGVATYKPTQIPGSYKISATALGKTVTKTLNVKHVVTLKSLTVKKSAKKLVIQAVLAKVNGKYLKDKKIIFKFNGKKYTAKTNKKGVAKVIIKKKVIKKLKKGKKVTYQATYLKDTVKKSTKVKK